METPQNPEGQLTERIMAAIDAHIRRDPPPQESHHYNRAYEAVYAILRTIECSRCGGPNFVPRKRG